MTHPTRRVIGAGPAGLVAAATLARAGEQVQVWERAGRVAGRFAGDFQGLEAWTDHRDLATRLAALGIEPTVPSQPVREVTFYDARLRPQVVRSDRPLFHLVRRGNEPGSLDRALLSQAQEAGAVVRWRTRAEYARAGDIVATGPRFADGLVVGYLFDTDLPNQARCILSRRLAPAGYAYLLVHDGHATLASCLFTRQQDWRAAREATADTFRKLIPDLGSDLAGGRPFAGYGNVFGAARLADKGGRLYVGEAGTRLLGRRLHYRDRACHTPTCDCLWCIHGGDKHDPQA